MNLQECSANVLAEHGTAYRGCRVLWNSNDPIERPKVGSLARSECQGSRRKAGTPFELTTEFIETHSALRIFAKRKRLRRPLRLARQRAGIRPLTLAV
jgi:hypothetical protein